MTKCVGDFIHIDMQLLFYEKAFYKKSIKPVHTSSAIVLSFLRKVMYHSLCHQKKTLKVHDIMSKSLSAFCCWVKVQ